MGVEVWSNRVARKVGHYETALHVLDLSRDVPRSADDIRDAVTAWMELGGELGKPHYATFFAKLQAGTPYLSVGTYRVLILSALAQHPAVAVDNLTASMPDTGAWKAEPDNVDAMHEFYTRAVQTRNSSLVNPCSNNSSSYPDDLAIVTCIGRWSLA